jgi:hypothetical protein
MKRKRNRKKRIGINLASIAALLLAAFIPLAASAKKKPALDTYAIVSGSVFQESGFALPGANATLVPEPPAGNPKRMEAVSSARGEFVFRVPPGPAHYNVTVEAKGYQSQHKTVRVEDQERVEVTFQMERESK